MKNIHNQCMNIEMFTVNKNIDWNLRQKNTHIDQSVVEPYNIHENKREGEKMCRAKSDFLSGSFDHQNLIQIYIYIHGKYC